MESAGEPTLGGSVKAVAEDLKTIAQAEVELGGRKLRSYVERTLLRASVLILGAFVALIGLAMLSVVAVLLLRPWIELYWVRLLIMGAVYLVVGSISARWFVAHVITKPDLSRERREMAETAAAVKHGIER